MNSMPLKQKAILAVLGVVALYAVVVVMWFMNLDRKMGWCPKSWGDAMRKYETACRNYQDECKLIGDRRKWTDKYEAAKNAMPNFDTHEATDTTWQRKLDAMSTKHHISISSHQAGKEVMAGEVSELPITVKSFEGALESLTKFMHEVENTEEGMYDIKTLKLSPNRQKRGYLKGSFVLTCAYMREN